MFLENRSALEPLVDALEFKGTSLECDSPKTQLFHSHINIVYPRFEDEFNEIGIGDFMKRRGLSHFSFHIGLSDATYPFIPIRHKSLEGRPLSREKILDNAKKSIDFLRTQIGGVISAENLDYIEGGSYETVCEPDFITEFVERFDLAFLLDIGHLLVASRMLGRNPYDYLDELPLEKTHEIHFHKAETVDGVWRDLHALPTDEEYKILEKALERAAPEFVNLECYSDPEGVAENLARLREMVS
ncbi:MAG: DUF692 family multinuclear iron-containing protein [bacterium]